MEIKIQKHVNSFGYYGVSFFENGRFIHFVMRSIDECRLFVAEKSNYEAVRSFIGSKFEVWCY